ncbi:MAG: glycoside hydrolase family 88 protein [bacterium]
MIAYNRSLFTIGVLCFLSLPALAQDSLSTERKLRSIADGVLKKASFEFLDQKSGTRFASPDEAPRDSQLRPESPYTDWRYWNGVLNLAMMRLGDVLRDSTYISFAYKNVDFGFDHYRYFQNNYTGENKWDYPFGEFFIMEELDDCGAMGASVIEVYRHSQQERYKQYIDLTASHMQKRQQRLKDGTFVRSFPHQWTLWADDLYMSISFLARMGELTHDRRYFNDAAQQVINFQKYLFDERTGIMHHCWYSDVNRPGIAFWGRANGWALIAQVDLLDRLPKNHPHRQRLLSLFRRHIFGVAQYQSETGLWHQLLDKVDSYLETSGSAMITYTIARAVNNGYIEPRYASIAERGWEGILSRIRSDGMVEGVCAGTVVSDDLVHYYQRPTPLNDIHGIGAILLAGSEMLRLSKKS